MIEMPDKKIEGGFGSPDRDLLVKNFMQRELLKRYLRVKLGEDYADDEKRHAAESHWAEKTPDAFRKIFNEEKEEFLKAYESRDEAIIEALLDRVIERLKAELSG